MKNKISVFFIFCFLLLGCSSSNVNNNFKVEDIFSEFGFSSLSSAEIVKDVFNKNKNLEFLSESSSSPYSSLKYKNGRFWNFAVEQWQFLFKHSSISRLTIIFSSENNIDSLWDSLNLKLEQLYKWKAFKSESIDSTSKLVHLTFTDLKTCRRVYEIVLERSLSEMNRAQIKLIYANSFNQPEI